MNNVSMVVDKRYLEVLTYLKNEHCDLNFKIISKQDILSALPESRQMQLEELNILLKSLEGKQLITIKFNDESEICVSLTAKGAAEMQEVPAVIETPPIVRKPAPHFLFVAFCFVASFLGALAGVIVGKFI